MPLAGGPPGHCPGQHLQQALWGAPPPLPQASCRVWLCTAVCMRCTAPGAAPSTWSLPAPAGFGPGGLGRSAAGRARRSHPGRRRLPRCSGPAAAPGDPQTPGCSGPAESTARLRSPAHQTARPTSQIRNCLFWASAGQAAKQHPLKRSSPLCMCPGLCAPAQHANVATLAKMWSR